MDGSDVYSFFLIGNCYGGLLLAEVGALLKFFGGFLYGETSLPIIIAENQLTRSGQGSR